MTIMTRLGFRAAQPLIAVGIGAGALALAAATALANGSDSRTLTLYAAVPAICTMTDFTQDLLTIQVSGGLPSTDTVSAETIINCNVPSLMRLTSIWGGMVETSVGLGDNPEMTNFASRFNYVARVKSGSTTFVTLDTADDPGYVQQESSGIVPAFDATTTTADMTVTVEVTPALPAGGQFLMAGQFSDQLTLEILPQN